MSENLQKEIKEFLNLISNRVGHVIDEYYWREACGLLKQMTDEKKEIKKGTRKSKKARVYKAEK